MPVCARAGRKERGGRRVSTCPGDWSRVRPDFPTRIAPASHGEHRLRTGTVGSGRLKLLTRGYPLLAVGPLSGGLGGHAICLTGLRTPAPPEATDSPAFADAPLAHVYAHDDNFGPNVRWAVKATGGKEPCVFLAPDAPSSDHQLPDPLRTKGYAMMPFALVAALPADIRLTVDGLLRRATWFATLMYASLGTNANLGVSFGIRFWQLSRYLKYELPRRTTPTGLATARRELAQKIPPMSEYLGIVRVSLGGKPILDVLIDSTDNQLAARGFATVAFDKNIGPPARILSLATGVPLIEAW